MLDSFWQITYLSRFTKISFSDLISHQSVYLYKLSFLTTINTYKDYFKGYHRWCNLMQKFLTSILWLETIFPSSSFTWRNCCVCTPYGFVTKELCDLHHVDELKNFAANILLKLVVSHVLGFVHRLVSHVLGVLLWKERLSLQNKSN